LLRLAEKHQYAVIEMGANHFFHYQSGQTWFYFFTNQ
jgi:UDP-N-acetylmuramyl pentapeptide synthase